MSTPSEHLPPATARTAVGRLIQRLKLGALRNARHGAIPATAADLDTPPLSTIRMSQLGEILDVGHIASVADLAALLSASESAIGAGSAALRLARTLRECPPPHTPAALATALEAKRRIDEKILRARPLRPIAAGELPTGEHRDVIGGHSRHIRNSPATFVVDASTVTTNPNGTVTVKFRKVARGDAGTAAAVVANAPGNVIGNLLDNAAPGMRFIATPPGFLPQFTEKAPAEIQRTSAERRNAFIRTGTDALAQFESHVERARNAARAPSTRDSHGFILIPGLP